MFRRPPGRSRSRRSRGAAWGAREARVLENVQARAAAAPAEVRARTRAPPAACAGAPALHASACAISRDGS